MSFWTPKHINEPALRVSSYSGTRPPNGSTEHNITMASGSANAKGSWVEVLSDTVVTDDLFWLDVWVSWNNVGAVARNCSFDIGVDEAGGTSYSVVVPDLCASMAVLHTLGGGQRYAVPMHIRAGSSIAARLQSADGGGTCGIAMRGYGKPRSGVPPFAGKYATAFGFDSATTTGTAVTAGGASEGSWTTIASSISRDHHWWQVGMSCTDTTMTSGLLYHVDVAYGDASNKQVIIEDLPWRVCDGNETLACPGAMVGAFRRVPAGANLYLRAQCSGTADTGLGWWLVGVGG